MTTSNKAGEQAENIWYHYKWQIIGAVVGLVLVTLVVVDVAGTPRPDVVVAVVSSSMLSPEQLEELATHLVDHAAEPDRFTLNVESLYVSGAFADPPSAEEEWPDGVDPMTPASIEASQMVRLTASLTDKNMALFLLDESSYRYLAKLHQLTLIPELEPDSTTHQLLPLSLGGDVAEILSPAEGEAEASSWYLLVAPNQREKNESFTQKYLWQMSIAAQLLEFEPGE